MLNDFFNLIFPKLCYACNKPLLKSEEVICLSCSFNLPQTNYHLDADNPLNKIFWGRIDVQFVCAFLTFKKGNSVQKLLHKLKYKNAPEVGAKIGQLYGLELKKAEWFKEVDIILPVPLHKKKLKKRGYNQSQYFAEGISETTVVPVDSVSFVRNIYTDSQTKKSRYSRWQNVEDIFSVENEEVLKGKTVLLVDDVITTGATIEACTVSLLKNDCRVYVATIACAK